MNSKDVKQKYHLYSEDLKFQLSFVDVDNPEDFDSDYFLDVVKQFTKVHKEYIQMRGNNEYNW